MYRYILIGVLCLLLFGTCALSERGWNQMDSNHVLTLEQLTTSEEIYTSLGQAENGDLLVLDEERIVIFESVTRENEGKVMELTYRDPHEGGVQYLHVRSRVAALRITRVVHSEVSYQYACLRYQLASGLYNSGDCTPR